MTKFRKKPVVIEAWQMTADNWAAPVAPMPAWLFEALELRQVWSTPGKVEMNIVTLEGTMVVSENDWIIQGVKGELYPCKPDIFAETYEPV